VRRETLLDYFGQLAGLSQPYLVHDDGFRVRTRTYAEVAAAGRGLAVRLAAAGIRKGDHVVVWSENRPEWVAAFWGCLLTGAVVVPVDARTSAAFLARIARRIDARLVVVGDDVPPVPDDLAAPVWRMREFDWADGAPPAVSIGGDDVAEVVFTSGATDEPKGVVITHRNVLANVVPVEREIAKYRHWARPVLPLGLVTLLPLSHMFGQALTLFIPPLLPGTVVFPHSHHPADVIEVIRRRRASVLVCVPKMLDVLEAHVRRVVPEAGQPPWPRHWVWRWWQYRRLHRLFGWRFWSVVVGGAPLDPEVEAFWASRAFAVIQGYGLTETAPIVTMSHPFRIRKGSVGKAIAGVEVRVAADGEILVRGENVTRGYVGATTDGALDDGWLHTGDLGAIGPDGALFIRGRKKEIIVAADGTKVFPEDVERVVDAVPGVRESAAVGVSEPDAPGERVYVAVVADATVDPDGVAGAANARLEAHQRIRRVLVWPGAELPRTSGTRKLKRTAIREWARTGVAPSAVTASSDDRLAALVARYSGRPIVASATTFDELGLSSLDRVELLAAVEDAFQTRIDEQAFAAARDIGALRALVASGAAAAEPRDDAPSDRPSWNQTWPARALRRVALGAALLLLTRVVAWLRVDGREHLAGLSGPAIFAANHQSYLDAAVIMAALPPRWRYRLAPAMSKEFFAAHFYPAGQGRLRRSASGLVYRLAALLFNAFPLPQRHAGARQTMRYAGELVEAGMSILIFPEGEITDTGAITWFRPGVGMLATRLQVPVVPVRLHGMDRVLHRRWRMVRPGRVRVTFGLPLRVGGDDHAAAARQVEQAVRALPPADPPPAPARAIGRSPA
jgi:long-chain acyl-CoA synthetase